MRPYQGVAGALEVGCVVRGVGFATAHVTASETLLFLYGPRPWISPCGSQIRLLVLHRPVYHPKGGTACTNSYYPGKLDYLNGRNR